MGSGPTTRRRRRLHVLQVSFVLLALCAAGLVSAGVVSGAGPLAALSDSTTTETSTESTDETTTDSTETTTETESTEPTTTESSALPTGPPTLVSDKADYMPGETVTLTGENWAPGEPVHIVVNDDVGQTWSRTTDIIANLQGEIFEQFQLPTSFVATYTATATGPVSGTATTSFTDGNVKWDTSTPADVTETLYSAANNCSGAIKNGYPKTLKSTDTVGVGNNESLRLDAEAVADNGQSFVAWSSSSPFTVIAGTSGRSICIPGFQSGSRDYLATYSANTTPTANNVSDSTNEDMPKAVTLSGSDPQQCELTFSIVSGPTNGTLGSISNTACTPGSPNTDTATVVYTPTANYNGSDSFTYRVNDGSADSAAATVSVTINPVNDAPSFSKGADQTVNEDSGAQTVAGWATAISPGPANESAQTVSFIVTNNTNPSLFSAAPAVSPSGTLTYTPAANAFGSATITLKAKDSGGTANGGVDESPTQSFLITVTEVNDPPVAANDSASVAEDDSGGVLIDVMANDSPGPANESGQTLTLDSVTVAAEHGTAVIEAGKIRYTPTEADYFGPDSFTYKVCDNGTTNGVADPQCDTATVNVTVTPVNDPPTASADSASVPEDSATGVLVDVKVNDTAGPANESGQTLTITAVTQGTHGSVAIEAGKVRYIPTEADYFGPDSFTYTIQDNGQSGSPPADDFKSDTATVTVTVTPVNDPPDAVNDSKTVAEDSGANSIDVLDNDSEGPANESSQTLTITGVSTPAHGTAAIDNNGTPGNPDDDTVTYTPAANYFGPDSFTYTIQDNGQSGSPPADDFKSDTATVTVTVTAVNDAPVVTAGPNQSGNENDIITVSASFTDVEAGDSHTCSINWGDGSPASSGTVVEPSGSTPGTCTGSHTYLDDNPTASPGPDPYTVTITVTDNGTTNGSSDPESDSDTLTVRISNVNPVITGMTGPSGPVQLGSSASVTTSFTDVGSQDTHTCTYSWDDGTSDTTVTAPGTGNGSCTATHTYAAPGVYTVGVTVTDDDTGSATSRYEFVVVYDPSAGFVTGGGWINSPAGAYAAGPTLTGRANFGFVSKYKKGATIPEGQTEFQLHFATFNFHSTAYQWLVVSANGTKAQYKGDGKVNGGGDYGFLLTAYDGPDRFRIKIWDKGTSAVVYDNRTGASEDIDAANPQEIAGGSIVIHRGK